MPKVFDLRRFVEHSIEHKTPDEIIILSCLTWVPDVLGKTKEDISKIEYMKHGQISDEWFIECEEGPHETITIDQLIEKIHRWSTSHGLNKGDPYKQMIKITEEVGELAQGLLKGNDEQILDSIGDTIITLAILCQQRNIDITDAINYAYKAIEHRKGSMIDGTFIKEQDMEEISPMSETREVSQLEANMIIDYRRPYGKFWMEEMSITGQMVYIGIDNTTGDAWTEEFDDREEMLSWLRREDGWLEL